MGIMGLFRQSRCVKSNKMHRGNTILTIFTVLPLCLAAMRQSAIAQNSVTQSTSMLECSIQLSKSQFRSGEPVLVDVVITNRTVMPVSAAFWGLQKDQPIVNFHIVGTNGSTSLLSTKKELWCGTGVENVAILSNREYKFAVDLLKTWEWGGMPAKLPPGSYSVSAELFAQTPDGGRPKVAESRQARFEIVAGE